MGDAAVGNGREHHEAHGDDAIDDGEGDDRQSNPRPRLGGAIAVAPVKQAAQQPPPQGLGRQGRDRFRGRAHWFGAPLGWSGGVAGGADGGSNTGMVPVTPSGGSKLPSMPPIGSSLAARV